MRAERGSSRRELLRRAGALAAAGALASPRTQAAVPRRYPYLQHVLANRATVLWTTNEPGSGSVQFATDPAFTAPVTVQARARRIEPAASQLERAFTQFETELTGLTANTRYYYRVFLGAERLLPNATAAEFSFRTAPSSGEFRFLAFGDSGGNTPEQYDLRDLMLAERASLALHTGDIAYPFGTHQTYELYYLQVYRDLMRQLPTYPAVGNHDVDIQDGAAYLDIHALPAEGVAQRDHKRYYSFDWGDAHFVSLDSNLLPDVGRRSTMLEWLSEDLARTRKIWKIVMWHHAPYDGLRGEEPESRAARDFVVPVLESHGVQLVLASHHHIYERTHPLLRGERASGRAGEEGIVYVTTGGAGGGLHDLGPPTAVSALAISEAHFARVDVDGARLTISAIGLGGRVLDTLTITPRPTLGRSVPVNAATLRQPVAPGSLISIFGQHLSPQQLAAPGLPLPVELSGVKVSLDGRQLPLAFVSPERITAQLPFGAVGAGSLRIVNGAATVPVEVPLNVLRVAPGIFGTPSGPSVVGGNGALVSAANPAVAGETVSLFMTGLGDVASEIAAGAPAPFSPLVPVQARVEVEVGGKRSIPSFAGLAPGQAGVYQVNAQVPGDLATGRHSLVVLADGVRSNEIVLDVRGSGGA